MTTYYKDTGAKNEIEALYRRKLDELSLSYELMTIETTQCNTNVVITGTKGKPPLVLLHGHFGAAPFAIETMVGLAPDFRIYALDIPEHPNLSEEFRLSANNESYGEWMYEILSRLRIYNATMVGISLGGFIALKSLLFDEKRISQAYLVVPAGIVSCSLFMLSREVILPIIKSRDEQDVRHVRTLPDRLFTEKDEFAEAFLTKVILNYNLEFSSIPEITEEEAEKVKTPITVFAAEQDILYPGEKMIEQAKKLFPSLEEAVLLRNSKHVLSKKNNKYISDFIRKNSEKC